MLAYSAPGLRVVARSPISGALGRVSVGMQQGRGLGGGVRDPRSHRGPSLSKGGGVLASQPRGAVGVFLLQAIPCSFPSEPQRLDLADAAQEGK